MKTETVSVKKNSAGAWMMTIDGCWLGDSRPWNTREQAIAYAKKISANWENVRYDFPLSD
jgi:hypothetical protein